MINLQFPKLNNALIKNQKEMDENDPRRGVIIVDNHAIVLNAKFCLVVNLYDYFSLDCGISAQEELAELKKILFYMNGKTFNSEYWNELVKGANMEIQKNMLLIETPKYAKDLYYKDMDINLYEPLQRLIEVSEYEQNMVPAISLPFAALDLIYNTLKAEFKDDHIILEFTSTDRPVKFTFKDRKFVFGFIMPHYASLEEGFRFEHLENFAKNETVGFLLEEHTPALVPEAPEDIPEVPEIPNLEEEILKNRPSLFNEKGE
jgi:hypothetical protein